MSPIRWCSEAFHGPLYDILTLNRTPRSTVRPIGPNPGPAGYTIPMQLPPRAGRPGFTVMEVLVASSVLTVAIAGAAFMMTSAYGAYRHQDRTMDMDRLVHDELERLSATSYPDLATKIRQARRPEDPVKDGAPTDDFTMNGSGDATVRYKLNPPKDKDDWRPVPPAVPLDADGKPLPVSPPDPHALRVSERLQFWDPAFDQPSQTDSGLIRATFELHGDGVDKEGVKYLSRTICQDDPGSR